MPRNELAAAALTEARDELTDYSIYMKLADMESDSKAKQVFLSIAEKEYNHYKFWLKYSAGGKPSPIFTKFYFAVTLRFLFGRAFVIKYLERVNHKTISKYARLASLVPVKDRPAAELVIDEEVSKEQEFAKQVQGTYVKYISFIVLGLADALVEIAGIHAGSLGIYNSTQLTGFAGIIAGAAASIAMASAAFAQAKHGFDGSPMFAALYTGVSYFISALLLATPYFLTSSMTLALSVSLIVGLIIIVFVSWYNSIMAESDFRKDFAELAGVMILATVVLFLLGSFIRYYFGLTI
jgi:VIT1/CCC1 family predicted Fe2+/Mn2+ transporter